MAADNLFNAYVNTAAHRQVRVIACGAGQNCGRATLYVENLSGQNDSFLPDFETLAQNAANANMDPQVETHLVDILPLDGYCQDNGVSPDFIKIDVEGFEVEVLLGAERLLAERRPILIVEVLPANRSAVREILNRHAYRVLEGNGHALTFGLEDGAGEDLNICCLPSELNADSPA